MFAGIVGSQDVPGWALALSSMDLDFANGRYHGGHPDTGLSLTRASSALAQDADGTWRSFGSGVLRITDQGLLIEEARTNKCTNYNANPTDTTNVAKSGDAAATLTVVDDTAALLAAGLQNIVTSGKVYKLDNSAGGSGAIVTITGQVGNTNKHSISIYVRGSGSGFAQLSGGEGSLAITYTSSYVKRTSANITPGASTRQFQITASAGAVVYFILTQLEEGAFVTSPIVVAGSSAARALDAAAASGQLDAKLLASKSIYLEVDSVAGGTDPTIVSFGGGAKIYFKSSTTVAITDGTNEAVATIGGGGDYSGTTKIACSMGASSFSIIANGGTKATSANAWDGNTGTVHIGSVGGASDAINAYLKRLASSNTEAAFDARTA